MLKHYGTSAKVTVHGPSVMVAVLLGQQSLHYGPCTIVPLLWSQCFGPSTMVPVLLPKHYGPSAMVTALWFKCYSQSTMLPAI